MSRTKRFLATAFLITTTLLAGCDSVDQTLTPSETDESFATHRPDAESATESESAEKAYVISNLVPFITANLTDDNGGTWSLTFETLPVSNGVTSFTYELDIPANPTGTFQYHIPECADYVSGSASPAPTAVDGNTLEWDASAFSVGVNALSLGFHAPAGQVAEQIGIVNVGIAGVGTDEAPVLGPCAGVFELKGTVFINDTSEEGGTTNDDKDPGEPGVGNVEVAVQEWTGTEWVYDDSPRQLSGSTEGSFGQYSFLVLGAAAPSLPERYRVVIPKTATLPGAVNDGLFGGVVQLACDDDCPVEEADLVAKEANLEIPEDLDFGFEVRVEEVIQQFEAGDLLSDGRSRAYWYTQFRQRRRWGTPIDFNKAQLMDFLNCSVPPFNPPGPIDCIFDPRGNSNDFSGGVDDLVQQILPIDRRRDLLDARRILRKIEPPDDDDDDGLDPEAEYRFLQLELQQQLLVSLLNFTVGRGVCKAGLGADDRCLEFDEGVTRILIENAIVVLVNSEFSVLGKASSGSVGSNADMLESMNG